MTEYVEAPPAAKLSKLSASATVREARARLKGRMELIYVPPDYYGDYPKPCMRGWGRRLLSVAPNGDVLPCLAGA